MPTRTEASSFRPVAPGISCAAAKVPLNELLVGCATASSCTSSKSY
ncbi:Uncharacterised protein [Bordetella pertussis]|nr:Uncharacterised protein [Bordetella pertussis]